MIRTSNIYHHITQFGMEMDTDILAAVEKIVKDNKLPPKEYEIEDIEEYLESMTNYLDSNMEAYQHFYETLTKLESKLSAI